MIKSKNKSEKKKSLSPKELLNEYKESLFALKFQAKSGNLVKTHQIKETKKKIARILTKQNQKKIEISS